MEKLHPIELSSTTPSFQMGVEIMKLRYDLVLEVLQGMFVETDRQASADYKRGRKTLSDLLMQFAVEIGRSLDAMLEINDICKPYIEAEKKTREGMKEKTLFEKRKEKPIRRRSWG